MLFELLGEGDPCWESLGYLNCEDLGLELQVVTFPPQRKSTLSTKPHREPQSRELEGDQISTIIGSWIQPFLKAHELSSC